MHFKYTYLFWKRHIGNRSIVIMINDRRKTYFKLIDPSHNDCVLFCIQLWHLMELNCVAFAWKLTPVFITDNINNNKKTPKLRTVDKLTEP